MMSEQEVTDAVVGTLRQKISNQQTVTQGEISLSHVPWRCDILVKHLGEPALAVECKGDSDIRRGIGQALSYMYVAGKAGIAAYEISDVELDFIANLPLYCFNVSDSDGFVEVVIESRPDNDEQLSNIEFTPGASDEFARIQKEKHVLQEEIERLKGRNRRLSDTLKDKKELTDVLFHQEGQDVTKLVNKTAVKDHLDKHVSSDLYDRLNYVIASSMHRAAVRAKLNGRNTVYPRDL